MQRMAAAAMAAEGTVLVEPSPFDWIAWSVVKTGGARGLIEADAMRLSEACLWLAMEREARGTAE